MIRLIIDDILNDKIANWQSEQPNTLDPEQSGFPVSEQGRALSKPGEMDNIYWIFFYDDDDDGYPFMMMISF